MATALTLAAIQAPVISILQASKTAWAVAVDGSNRMFPSTTEIDEAILFADAEISTIICNTIGSPYQTTFIQTSAALSNVAPLPSRNGMVLRVYGQSGELVAVDSVDPSLDIITFTVDPHPYQTGDLIQFVTTGTVGGGLAINTNYWVIYASSQTIQVASSYLNAIQGIFIDIAASPPASGTSAIQFKESMKGATADEVKEAIQNPTYFGSPNNSTFFIEGDYVYCTSPTVRIIYTDYTKTSAPQAPEPYRNALVAGAVARLLKDGADESVMGYYSKLFEQYQQMIATGVLVLPEFTNYAVGGNRG